MRFRLSCYALLGVLWAASLPVSAATAKAPDSSNTDAAGAETAQAGAAHEADTNKSDYILQPEDVIRVQVLREDEINKLGEVQVSQDFTVVLPLIGSVDLRGKSVRQAQTLIRELYDRDYLVNPHVNVSVIRYVERVVKVFGMVNKPGPVPFPPESGLTLSGAISRAEGFTRLADQKKVTLTRTLPDGSSRAQTINAANLLKGGPGDVPLQAGDIINVGERLF